MTELDEDEGGFGVDDLLPVAGVPKTFAALTTACEVEALGVGPEQFRECRAPAGFVGDGGITGEGDACAWFISETETQERKEQEEMKGNGGDLTSDDLPSRTVNRAVHVRPVLLEVGGGIEEGVVRPVETLELMRA